MLLSPLIYFSSIIFFEVFCCCHAKAIASSICIRAQVLSQWWKKALPLVDIYLKFASTVNNSKIFQLELFGKHSFFTPECYFDLRLLYICVDLSMMWMSTLFKCNNVKYTLNVNMSYCFEQHTSKSFHNTLNHTSHKTVVYLLMKNVLQAHSRFSIQKNSICKVCAKQNINSDSFLLIANCNKDKLLTIKLKSNKFKQTKNRNFRIEKLKDWPFQSIRFMVAIGRTQLVVCQTRKKAFQIILTALLGPLAMGEFWLENEIQVWTKETNEMPIKLWFCSISFVHRF